MTDGLRLALRAGATIETDEEGHGLKVGSTRLAVPTPGSRGAVEALRSLVGTTEEEMVALALVEDGYEGLATLYRLLGELASRRALCHRLLARGGVVIESEPISSEWELGVAESVRARRFTLSRFALLRRRGERIVLESPRSTSRLVLADPRGVALVGALAEARTESDLVVEGWSPELLADALRLLEHGSFLTEVAEDGVCAEDGAPSLVPWDFHDLLFHARSRLGRSDEPYGARFPLRGTMEPLPAVKAPGKGESIALFRPDLERLLEEAPPFSRILESRRSRREQGAVPISEDQLGELLFRAARIRGRTEGAEYETTDRVYPGGGAAYELEIYPVIDRCGGLTSGLYRYDPLDHRLLRLAGRTPEVEILLETAAHIARCEAPQVLLVIAARFARVAWKYSGMAYATILKDVGVLVQTLYLVATAMGLAPCALGGGDADLFSRASGTDYYAESSVGELIVGSSR